MLSDFYRTEPIADFLGAGEAAAFRIPPPRRKVDPAMAGDGQREIDGPAKFQNCLLPKALLPRADQAASSACDRSARMSSSCSIPIDNRT
jgi:hypothetical protein